MVGMLFWALVYRFKSIIEFLVNDLTHILLPSITFLRLLPYVI